MLSFVAGVLSILSPCVLRPIVLGAAAGTNGPGAPRRASISFVAMGFVAPSASIGLDGDVSATWPPCSCAIGVVDGAPQTGLRWPAGRRH